MGLGLGSGLARLQLADRLVAKEARVRVELLVRARVRVAVGVGVGVGVRVGVRVGVKIRVGVGIRVEDRASANLLLAVTQLLVVCQARHDLGPVLGPERALLLPLRALLRGLSLVEGLPPPGQRGLLLALDCKG